MKLHRLILTNYRGIDHRQIDFPDHGVAVVAGANEVGKSSMIEALDVLLEAKDRSKHKDVKAIKPTHADVGAEITAEISTGPYHFTYYKRFHKAPETVLTLSAPRHEQLTGDDAHDRVRAILAETVDTGLWRAMRVLQATGTTAVDLSGCDALSRALDLAAGDTGALTGNEPALIERIEAEYARYFTPTGRSTGEWAAATTALAAAEQKVAHCSSAVSEIDERVRRHATMTDQLAAITAEQQAAKERLTAARQASDHVGQLKQALHNAELAAEVVHARSAASDTDHAARQQLRDDLAARDTAVNDLAAQMRKAATAAEQTRTAADTANAAAQNANRLAEAAEQRVASARRITEQLADHAEADRLAARLSKIDATREDYERVNAELASITLTESMLTRIENAAAATDRTAATLEAMAATVQVTAAADIELLVAGQRITLPAGHDWSATATTRTDIEIAGVLTARITPGISGLDSQAAHTAAQQELREALAAAALPDLEAARRTGQQRRVLVGRRDQISAALDALRGDDDIGQLQTRLDDLHQAHATAPATECTYASARAELTAADTGRAQAVSDREATRAAATSAREALERQSAQLTRLKTEVAGQQAERDTLAARLAAQRAQVSDDDLAAQAETNRDAASAVAQQVCELAQKCSDAEPEATAAELASATETADGLSERHRQVAVALRDIEVELTVLGTEGRHTQLDAAEIALEHATTAHSQIGRRARAVELLRAVITRHRDDTRRRYVEPFRCEIERLGRDVFGKSFTVDVDTDLRICTRTLNGRTVSYDALSGGAKEQLGILTRLACAALVAKEDTVPVLIDDALGFTDPDRLTKMGAVLNTVGGDGQVIVLTCTPARYDSVADAYLINLESSPGK